MEIRLFLQYYNSSETLICRACCDLSQKIARKVTDGGWCFFETGEKIAFMFHPII